MSKISKLLDAMKANPKDWRIEDLKTVARRLRIEIRNDGGSHHVFSYPGLSKAVSVPAHRPIKPVYIRAFVEFCNQVKEENDE
ncbi:MAG: hypothetical protein NC112_05410 [Oxalobacter formigenes]|nr:hypothetical protein [Oxalobacter formigenes]